VWRQSDLIEGWRAVWRQSDLIEGSEPVLVAVFVLLFAMTTIGYSLVVTTFFSTSKTGAGVGFFFFFAISMPGAWISKTNISVTGKLLLCLLSPSAFSTGWGIINAGRLRWTTLFDPGVSDFGLSFAAVCAMMAVDIVVYVSLAWYLDK
ncbi:hypothetical protein CYMTET_29747, partial [Cymbomonas tetramitiformis]